MSTGFQSSLMGSSASIVDGIACFVTRSPPSPPPLLANATLGCVNDNAPTKAVLRPSCENELSNATAPSLESPFVETKLGDRVDHLPTCQHTSKAMLNKARLLQCRFGMSADNFTLQCLILTVTAVLHPLRKMQQKTT